MHADGGGDLLRIEDVSILHDSAYATNVTDPNGRIAIHDDEVTLTNCLAALHSATARNTAPKIERRSAFRAKLGPPNKALKPTVPLVTILASGQARIAPNRKFNRPHTP